MKKSNPNTYSLRRRGLANFRSPARADTPVVPALATDYERQRVNFEQRRLEHLRESWRAQGAL